MQPRGADILWQRSRATATLHPGSRQYSTEDECLAPLLTGDEIQHTHTGCADTVHMVICNTRTAPG